MSQSNPLLPSNKALALLVAIVLSGCKSGHENSGDDTTDPTDPTVISISIPDAVSVAEPTSGSTTNEIGITLSDELEFDLELIVSSTDITATSTGQFQNYSAIDSQVVTIPTGATTSTIALDVQHNELFEGDKTLSVTISADTNSSYTIENDVTTITIQDVDTTPTVSFSTDLSTVVEGDSIAQAATLNHYTDKDVTITLTQSGIAASDDYSVDIVDSQIIIPAKTISTSVEFSAHDDGFNEGGESVIYTMSEVGNAIIDTENNILAFYIPGQKSFNDTGYVTYSDGTVFDSTTPPSTHPNQDADYGVDTTQGDEHADGEYGFRYTKLDAHGNPLDSSETNWRCVRDERTGIYIENKQAPAALPTQDEVDTWVLAHQGDPDANPYLWENESDMWRSSSYTYTWYDSSSETNGGFSGAQNELLYSEGPISDQCAYLNDDSGNRYCNTESYIESMNSYAICGITDWRLPSPVEARSFISYNVEATPPASKVDFFPNLGDRIFTHSSSVKQNGSARCVDTDTGEMALCNKNITGSTGIVAVSGGIE